MVNRGIDFWPLLLLQGLENAHCRTVNVTGYERHSDPLPVGKQLELFNEPISFSLHKEIDKRKLKVSINKPCGCGRSSDRSVNDPSSVGESGTSHRVAVERTRSSNNSASALNLLTNPESPIVPVFPRATNGFSLDSSAVSRNTIRG